MVYVKILSLNLLRTGFPLGYVASNGRLIDNLDQIWKETVMT
jgi:hypothetical protein